MFTRLGLGTEPCISSLFLLLISSFSSVSLQFFGNFISAPARCIKFSAEKSAEFVLQTLHRSPPKGSPLFPPPANLAGKRGKYSLFDCFIASSIWFRNAPSPSPHLHVPTAQSAAPQEIPSFYRFSCLSLILPDASSRLAFVHSIPPPRTMHHLVMRRKIGLRGSQCVFIRCALPRARSALSAVQASPTPPESPCVLLHIDLVIHPFNAQRLRVRFRRLHDDRTSLRKNSLRRPPTASRPAREL